MGLRAAVDARPSLFIMALFQTLFHFLFHLAIGYMAGSLQLLDYLNSVSFDTRMACTV